MNIVVVESPSKAKTINKYLGSGYEVLASFGHIRDLPPKDGSVDPDNEFRMLWEVDAKSNQRLAPRLIRRHARAAVFLGLLVDVKAELFGEPALERAATAKRPDPPPEFTEFPHDS